MQQTTDRARTVTFAEQQETGMVTRRSNYVA